MRSAPNPIWIAKAAPAGNLFGIKGLPPVLMGAVKTDNPYLEMYMKYVSAWEGGYGNDRRDVGGETNRGVTFTTWQDVAPKIGQDPSHEAFLQMTADQSDMVKQYLFGVVTVGISDPIKQMIALETLWASGNYFWKYFLGTYDQNVINQWINNHSTEEWYAAWKDYITNHLADLYAIYQGWGYRWSFVPSPYNESDPNEWKIGILTLFDRIHAIQHAQTAKKILIWGGIGLSVIGLGLLGYRYLHKRK